MMHTRTRPDRAPRAPCLWIAALLCTWHFGLSSAAAHLSRPETLDVTLLRADAIFAADVGQIQPTRAGRFRVSLSGPAIVANRWPAPPTSFELQGEALLTAEEISRGAETTGLAAIRALPYEIDLRRGHRYLFFLSGGSHRGAPSDAATPFYEIDADGHVVCGSGFVYGLAPMGLICGRPGEVAGEPLFEGELRERLVAAVARAHERRPDLAAARDGDVRPLESPESEEP